MVMKTSCDGKDFHARKYLGIPRLAEIPPANPRGRAALTAPLGTLYK